MCGQDIVVVRPLANKIDKEILTPIQDNRQKHKNITNIIQPPKEEIAIHSINSIPTDSWRPDVQNR